MSMAVGGGRKGQVAEINVTPMIDVLLVLLIIFMVVAPTVPRGLQTMVPQTPAADDNPPVRPADIVISVAKNGAIEVNQEPVAVEGLAERLASIFKIRGNTVVFVRGDKDLSFSEVAHVIDVARGAGLDRIALATNL